MTADAHELPSMTPVIVLGKSDTQRSLHSNADARFMNVVFKDLHYSVPSSAKEKKGERHVILKGVSGVFSPGMMTAVMGPSGSGKTTLMDLLSGRKTTGRAEGTILFGKQPPSRSLLRRHCGYCEQQDTLVDTLTVEEMLLYTALLKRPREEPLSAKKQEVERLLGKLALQGCRSTRIGSVLKRGISGGQAKRTNVGIALITDPSVLFLDEPTSGLDSWTANEVMGVVKSIVADGSVTIAATIHSPSSHCYSLFDRVLILVAGGVAYYGPTEQACIQYFADVLRVRPLLVGENLAEYVMDHCTRADQEGKSQGLLEAYCASDLAKKNDEALTRLVEEAAAGRSGHATPAAGNSLRRLMTCRSNNHHNNSNSNSHPGAGNAAVADASAAATALVILNDAEAAGDGGGCLSSGSDSWTYVTPWWSTLAVLLQYRTLRNYRSMEYLAPRMFDKIIFAVIIMALYFGIGNDFSSGNIPNMAALMYLCVAQPAWGAVAFIPAIVMERALYVRERNDGLYRPISYIIFKLVDELLLNWVVGLASSGIIFGGVHLVGSYIYFWLMLMATLSNGIVIAYALSALCPTMDIANAVVPTLLAVMLFLSGFLIRIPDIPVYLRWLTWVDLLKYSWGGLMINQFESHPEASLGDNHILEYYGLDKISKWGNLGIVAGYFCFWSVLAWLALAFVKHHQR